MAQWKDSAIVFCQHLVLTSRGLYCQCNYTAEFDKLIYVADHDVGAVKKRLEEASFHTRKKIGKKKAEGIVLAMLKRSVASMETAMK